MELQGFQVFNFRNIIDSGWVEAGNIRAIIAKNESGKSNLLEAFSKLNPYHEAHYNINEDWPADKWPPPEALDEIVCAANFRLNKKEIAQLWEFARSQPPPPAEGPHTPSSDTPLPDQGILRVTRSYNGKQGITVEDANLAAKLDSDKVSKWVAEHLPKCVYMNDYRIFDGHADLSRLADKIKEKGGKIHALSDEEQTILIILNLAQIDLAELMKKGQADETRTLRGFDTVRASKYLTRQFAQLWKQKDIEFEIRVDGLTLDILVEDIGLDMPIRLHRRSRGFQWYVSFIWQFSYATKGDFKNCILLLDEPGIHLHPAGHQDLLEFLEKLSQSNTVIYTTHLATMLDQAYPERVCIMEVSDHHATVRNGMYSTQAEPMMVIEQALGLNPSMSGLLGTRQTLIVEGGEDAVILQKLSGVLNKSGEVGLSDRVFLMPAAGAQKTPMYAGFMVGHKLDSAVLLDSDPAGVEAKKKISDLFLSNLAKESGSSFQVLMLAEAADIQQNEAAIEDLFPVNFFLTCVNDAYRVDIKESDLPMDGSDQISKRVENVLESRGLGNRLDKKRVLAEIQKRFDGMKTKDDLPEGTAALAQRLFERINAIFGTGSTVRRLKERDAQSTLKSQSK